MEDTGLQLAADGIPPPAGEGAVVPLYSGRVHQLTSAAVGCSKPSGCHLHIFAAVVELPDKVDVRGVRRDVTSHAHRFVQ